MTAGEAKFSEAISWRVVFCRSVSAVDQGEQLGVTVGGPRHGLRCYSAPTVGRSTPDLRRRQANSGWPDQLDHAVDQDLDLVGDPPVDGEPATDRIVDVVGLGEADRRLAVVELAQPVGHRQVDGPAAGLLGQPHQLLQGERARIGVGVDQHDLARCSRAMHEMRSASATNWLGDELAPVLADIEVAVGHQLDDLVGGRPALRCGCRPSVTTASTDASRAADAGTPRPSASDRCCRCTRSGSRSAAV